MREYKYIRVDKIIRDKIEELEIRKDYKYYCMVFMNKVVYSYMYSVKKENNDSWVRKSIESIKEGIFGDKKITYDCIRALENGGLIERGTSYLKDEYSKGFKPRILPIGKFITVKAEDYLNKRQITNFQNRLIKNLDRGVEWHLINLIKNVEVDLLRLEMVARINFNYDFKIYKTKDEFIEQIMAIEISEESIREHLKEIGLKRIRADRIEKELCKRSFLKTKMLELLELENTGIVKGEKGGRHFHALSNAPRELRACMISTNPKKPYLMQVDIKNSQPFLLLCLFEENNIEIEQGLKMGIIGGKFYEEIGFCWGFNPFDITNNHITRQEIKRKVYSNLLFADNEIRKESEYFQKVQANYPKFANAILTLTQNGETLASLLQELEAKQMLPVVKKFKAIGLHDAVLTVTVNQESDVEKVKEEILKRFKEKYKITPSLSVDKISERKEVNLKLWKHI